jgi:hypothetical protein
MTLHKGALALLVMVAALGCGKKADESGAGSAGKPVEPAAPATCPPGNVVKDGACVVVITPEKVAAVQAQATRLDDLAKFLDKVDDLAAPVELLNGFRQLDEWKQLKAKSDKLEIVDKVVASLDDGVKQLRAFKGSLGEASARLGNLKGELDRQLKETGAAKKLEEVRAQISSQLRAAIEPLAQQVQDTITKAIAPLEQQLGDTADLVIGACAMAKLSGGGDKLKTLCGQAKDVFAKATTYLADLKGKPAALYNELYKELQTQLGILVDTETQKLLDAAQAKVNDALKLPAAAGSGSGSAH